MIQYLRFFAPAWRLDALRKAPPEKRAAAWAAFLRETDPVPDTPINEDLESYFGRIERANSDFANDRNPGWLSDRGIVMWLKHSQSGTAVANVKSNEIVKSGNSG